MKPLYRHQIYLDFPLCSFEALTNNSTLLSPPQLQAAFIFYHHNKSSFTPHLDSISSHLGVKFTMTSGRKKQLGHFWFQCTYCTVNRHQSTSNPHTLFFYHLTVLTCLQGRLKIFTHDCIKLMNPFIDSTLWLMSNSSVGRTGFSMPHSIWLGYKSYITSTKALLITGYNLCPPCYILLILPFIRTSCWMFVPSSKFD